jgi:hypothetical protein
MPKIVHHHFFNTYSLISLTNRPNPSHSCPSQRQAGVAELVDARDSKSRFLGSKGSIPFAGISPESLDQGFSFSQTATG